MYEWLGKDFDGVIAFDEAHKMKSGLSVKKTRGKSKPSDSRNGITRIVPKSENSIYATQLM